MRRVRVGRGAAALGEQPAVVLHQEVRPVVRALEEGHQLDQLLGAERRGQTDGEGLPIDLRRGLRSRLGGAGGALAARAGGQGPARAPRPCGSGCGASSTGSPGRGSADISFRAPRSRRTGSPNGSPSRTCRRVGRRASLQSVIRCISCKPHEPSKSSPAARARVAGGPAFS